jgi:putative acetyltransferase
MSAEVHLRRFDSNSPRDAAAFRRLNLEWLERLFVVEADDHRVLNDPAGEIIRPGGLILFAEIAGEIVGCCALIAQPAEPGCWEVAKLAVTAGFQGRKIGRRLMEAMTEEARALGARRLVLVTNSGLGAARRLYESMHFTYLPPAQAGGLGHFQRGDTFMEKILG